MTDEEVRRDKPALGSTPQKESDPRIKAQILRSKFKQLKGVGQNFTGEDTMSWLVKMDDSSISAEETIMPGKLLDASQMTMPVLLDTLFDNLERYSFEFNKRNEDFSVNCLRPEGYQEKVDHFNRRKVSYMRGHLSSDDFSMVLQGTDRAVDIFIIPTDFLMGFDPEESDFPSFLTLEKLSVQESSSWGINRTKISFDEFPRLCRRLLTQLVKVCKGEAISTEKFSFSANPVEEKVEEPDRTFEELDDEIGLHKGEQLPSQPKQSDAEKLKAIKESLMTKVPMPRAKTPVSNEQEQSTSQAQAHQSVPSDAAHNSAQQQEQPPRSTASGAYAKPLASLAKSTASSDNLAKQGEIESIRSQSEPGTIAKPKLEDNVEKTEESEGHASQAEVEPEPARKETVSALSTAGVSSSMQASSSASVVKEPMSASAGSSASQSAAALHSSSTTAPASPQHSSSHSRPATASQTRPSPRQSSSESSAESSSNSQPSSSMYETEVKSRSRSESEADSDTDSGLFYKLDPEIGDSSRSKYEVGNYKMKSSRRKSLRGSASEGESRSKSKDRYSSGSGSRLKDRIQLNDKHKEQISNIGSDLDQIKQQVDDAQETVVDACCVIISGIDEALVALQEVGVDAMKTDNVNRVTEVMDESRRLRSIKEKLVDVADDISEV